MHKSQIFAPLLVSLLFSTGGCAILGAAPADIPTPTRSMPPPTASSTAPPTETPDPCEDEMKLDHIEKMMRLTRHFDDISILAQSTPQEQLAAVILEMQQILHQVEDMAIPTCLDNLHTTQLNYIRAVIATMTSFLQGAPNEKINAQINASRQIRQAYEKEKAAQLGIPYYTPTIPPTATATPVTPTATLGIYTATTRQDMYILQGPGVYFPAIGTFLVGDTVNVIGRLKSSDWLMIETRVSPGEPGWVLAQFVTLNTGLYNLPVVEAPPVE